MRHLFVTLLSLLCMSFPLSSLKAQITISTGTMSYATGTAVGSATGITFLVANNNGGPIAITSVGSTVADAGTMELWYSSTSLTGSTGSLTTANTAWTLASTITATGASTAINNNLFPGMYIVIPGGATFRFAVTNAGRIHL